MNNSAMHNTSHYRRQAQRLGLDSRAVAAMYKELRDQQREEREREWGIRRDSWHSQVSPGSRPFWRHGWQSRYSHAFAEGDRDNIPGFDATAHAVAAIYPELAADGDPSERLFQMLKQPHNRLPTSAETWEEALELVQINTACDGPRCDEHGLDFIFGANVQTRDF